MKLNEDATRVELPKSRRARNLIIIAHPDDESIGCLSVLKDSIVFLMTNPDAERMKVFDSICEEYSADVYKFNLPALELDKIGIHRIVSLLDYAYDYISRDNYIENVFGHYENDVHQDHRTLARATNIFARRTKDIKAYYQFFTDNSFPQENIILNVMPYGEKIRILGKYKNFLRPFHYNYIKSFYETLKHKYNLNEIAEPFVLKYRIGL